MFSFFFFQLLPDQTGSVNLLSLQKGRNGEEEEKSCLLLLGLGVRGMSVLYMELWLLCELSRCFPTSACQVLQSGMIAQKSCCCGRSIISMRCHLPATYLNLSEVVPVMAEQLKQKFSCFLGSPSLPVLYSGQFFHRFQKASSTGKNRT